MFLREWGDTLRAPHASVEMEERQKCEQKGYTLRTLSSGGSFQSQPSFCILWAVDGLEPHTALVNANIPAKAKELQIKEIQPFLELYYTLHCWVRQTNQCCRNLLSWCLVGHFYRSSNPASLQQSLCRTWCLISDHTLLATVFHRFKKPASLSNITGSKMFLGSMPWIRAVGGTRP